MIAIYVDLIMHFVLYNLSYIAVCDDNTDDNIGYLVHIYLEVFIQAQPDLHV